MGPQGLGLDITELRLGLPGGEKSEKKRMFSSCGVDGGGKNRNTDLAVGWPPVCLYRKKSVHDVTKIYVKISMDGAPILRKVDLSGFKGYSDLGMALEKLFNCYGIGTHYFIFL